MSGLPLAAADSRKSTPGVAAACCKSRKALSRSEIVKHRHGQVVSYRRNGGMDGNGVSFHRKIQRSQRHRGRLGHEHSTWMPSSGRHAAFVASEASGRRNARTRLRVAKVWCAAESALRINMTCYDNTITFTCNVQPSKDTAPRGCGLA